MTPEVRSQKSEVKSTRPESKHLLILTSVFWLLTSLSGCDSSLRITGKVMKGGAPLVPANGELVTVALYSVPEPGGAPADVYPANVSREDGAFKVPGKKGRGIPPGKYRISVAWRRGDSDLLKDVFSPDKSPIVREISRSQEIVIDLDNPTQQ